MVRNTITRGDKTYNLWIRIDTKKAFPDKILNTIQKVVNSKSGKRHVKKLSANRIICSPALYEKIQSQVDVLNSCEVSLFVEVGGGKTKALIKDAKNYGVVKDDYDKLLRYIYN